MKKIIIYSLLLTLSASAQLFARDDGKTEVILNRPHQHTEYYAPADMPEVYYDSNTQEIIIVADGFTSRDMGDLLTPYTRKPDPNADYQEYWGLSHIIKDGKIIYKGMRYNEDHLSGVDEVVAYQHRAANSNYYNLTGLPVGKDVPTTPGIYIHRGKKILVK